MSHSDQQLKDAFAGIDKDGSGAIDRAEIKALLIETLSIPADHAEVMAKDVMKDDPNGDGKITLAEFMQVMKK